MRKLLASLLVFLTLSAAQAQIVGTLPFTFTNGSNADATQVMANYNFIINQVNANAANNGANSTITSILGLTTPLSAGQGGSQLYTAGTSTGTANAQVVATGITPTGFALVGKPTVCFIAGFTNTAATTLNITGSGVTNIFKRSTSGPIALTGGEIVSGNLTCAQYDGTRYVMTYDDLNVVGKQVTLASAATTDLGTASTHNISITGTTTITSFGSTAQTDLPLYFLQFSGAVQLTHNATTMIVPGGVSVTTSAGDTAIAQYLGSGNWQIIRYYPSGLSPLGIGVALPGVSGLTIANNVTTPNSKIDIHSSYFILKSTTTSYVVSSSTDVNCVINLGTTGVNALDTGTVAINTWYYEYIISNGTTNACLSSISSTSPTMPATYVYSTRVGSMQTDASGNLRPTKQAGRRVEFTTLQANFSAGTITYATFFPPTSEAALVQVTSNGTAGSFSSLTDMAGINQITVLAVGGGGGSGVATVQNTGGTTFTTSQANAGSFIPVGWIDRGNLN